MTEETNRKIRELEKEALFHEKIKSYRVAMRIVREINKIKNKEKEK